ncbi:hypothetical protein DYQ86_16525 [Acidobacteria bacterium AB60]|nr:hypothetical protein DYQ86_16525 [Acidobacteria bacterium AB60]
MRKKVVISSVLVLSLVLIVGAMQEPAEKPASQAALSAPSQPLSQPGAKGVSKEETQPAVPVPPGPVPPSEIKPGPPTPIAVKKDELGDDENWDPKWDVMVEENLPAELLSPRVSRAVHPFCPRFESMNEADKRSFWAYFFQALAGAEAGLKPTSDVRHTEPEVAVIDKVTHRITRQEGLLQLTYEDSDRYSCDFDWDKDKDLPVHDPDKTILQPRNNLLCGINILKNQLIDLDEPLLTPKSYWATLRPGTLSYRVFAKQMTNVPTACGVKAPHPRKSAEPVREAEVVQPVTQPAQ